MLRSFFLRTVNNLYDLEQTRVIVLGNQKSGTTAIAKLLALISGKKVLLDSPLLWEPNLSRIATGKIDLLTLINDHKYYFARPIVKEPNLTFLFDQVVRIYPPSVKFVFIVRDPRDNIRSILNRLKVPGNLVNLDSYYPNFSIHEKAIFDKNIFSYQTDHYISQLAERWNMAADIYFRSEEDVYLVRYEDFKRDKVSFISNLALKMGFKPKFDIAAKIDIQYQPKGNHDISWLDFFGQKNLDRIINICGSGMQRVGYYF